MKSAIIFAAIILLIGCTTETEKPGLAIIGLQGGDTVRVNVGNTFFATFMIRNAKNVYAINALVQYDTTYLSMQKASDQFAEKGQFLGTNAILQTDFVGNIPGAIVFAYSKQTNIPGSYGEGDLWRVSMMALKPGLTKIGFDLSRCIVLSPNEIGGEPERLPARFDDKLIQIESEATPAEGDTSIIYIRID